MIGTLDSQVIEKFKEFQEKTGKYTNLDIKNVKFDKKILRDLHQSDKVTTQVNTTADKFIEIGDIDRDTKKYDITNKIKLNLPQKGKHAPEGTILVSRVRPLLGGYTIINGDNYTFTSGDLNPIVLPDYIDVNYVFKIICSPKFRTYLKNNQNTSGQKPTITNKLYDFDVPIPQNYNEYKSIDIQKAIVDFLEFWKINYTDDFRQIVIHQKPILEKIKKALIPATLRHDKTIVNSFNEFAKSNNYKIKLEEVTFKKIDFFNIKKNDLLSPKKLEKNQDLILQNSSNNGYPVYSGAIELLCKVDESKYPNKIFVANHQNPDISFANNGDGSAGRNFFVHTDKYFVNQERTVISFKNDNDFYSLYILNQIINMRDKYNMNRENRPTPKDLPKFGIEIIFPFHNNVSSFDLQKILVEFWKMILNNIDERFIKFDNIERLTDKVDEAFLYRTFSKIEWR